METRYGTERRTRRAPVVHAWLTLATALGVLLVSPLAHGYKLRVRGGAIIDGHVRFVEEWLELRGQLSDDGHSAIGRGVLRAKARGTRALADAEPCMGALGPAVDGGVTRIDSDAAGFFCMRWRSAPDKGQLVVTFAGDALHGAAEQTFAFDRDGPQRYPTELRFDPRPNVIDLDKPDVTIAVALAPASRIEGNPSRNGLTLELWDATRGRLATTTTNGDGRAEFHLASSELGDPGIGALEARFVGSDALAPATDSQAVIRRASVTLELADDIAPADPRDGAHIAVRAAVPHGEVADGIVEAVRAGQSIASAPIVGGRAELVATFTPRNEGDTRVVLRYLPQSPWWRAGRALEVSVPVAPPNRILRVLLSLVVLAAAAWVGVSWRRARKPPLAEAAAPPPHAPGVHVVATRSAAEGWTGTVVDAHDGVPVPRARVRISLPTLGEEPPSAIAEVESDAHGRFRLPPLGSTPAAARLSVRAVLFSTEEKPLPPCGELRVALVTRRRAALGRLVAWAQRRGVPFDSRPEPTPAHVQRAAANHPDVATWAGATEETAFGPAPVDAEAERKLRDLEPRP